MSGRLSFSAPTVEELQRHFTQYRIERFVAVGGMGAIYRAKQVSVDRAVALKILPPELAGDENFRRRFAEEARSMARLSHRNIVQLYDFGENHGIVWMTQEWIDGRTVEEVLAEEGALDPVEAAAMVAQACEGLAYAHKQGIVHRDVKPANLMEDNEGHVRVMDFGLARVIDRDGNRLRTGTGGRFATPEYAAPELWDLEREPDHRVDIFALGVLLFEALTGQRPMGVFQKPSEVRPGLDPRYDDVVIRALQRDPDRRFQNCRELEEALREVVTRPVVVAPVAPAVRLLAGGTAPVPLAAPAAPVPPQAGRPRGKRPLVFGAAGLVALAGGGFLVAAMMKSDEPKGAGGGQPIVKIPLAASGPVQPRGTDKERLEREAKERLAREEKKEREEAWPPGPSPADKTEEPNDPEPVEEPEGEPTLAERLAGMDEELRAGFEEAAVAYRKAWMARETLHLAACADGEAAARKAGDLDGVLFWRAEAAFVKGNGEPPRVDDGIPAEGVALRRKWREELDPLRDPLEQRCSAYLEQCAELAEKMEGEEDRAVLKKRTEAVESFPNFLALCRGEALLSAGAEEVVAGVEPGELPGKVLEARKVLDERMAILERRGDKPGMDSLLKAFGRLLVTEEKALVQRDEIGAAVAVRVEKDELLRKLEALAEGGVKPDPVAVKQSVGLVTNGEVSEACVLDRKLWRRRGSVLENEVANADLSGPAIGSGDFSIRLRAMVDRIGATYLTVVLGETFIQLDGLNGLVVVQRGGSLQNDLTGKSFGSLAKAGEFFDVEVARTGGMLKVLVNGQEAVSKQGHDREMGKLRLLSGSSKLQVEGFVAEGVMVKQPGAQGLMSYRLNQFYCERQQLVLTEDDGLLAVSGAWGGAGGERRQIFSWISRDGGVKWGEREDLVKLDDHGGQSARTFAVASSRKRDGIWLAYAVGEANHKVFVKEGRSGGRVWSKPEEITGQVAEPGWNVFFAAQGAVVERTEEKAGRILLPFLSHMGGASSLYVLVSDDGRKWRRQGPLMADCRREAEIMEDGEGKIWVSSGGQIQQGENVVRRWVVSEDCGETWTAPQASTLPDWGLTRGSVSMGEDAEGKAVWYYANVSGEGQEGTWRVNNLTLWGSRDGGRVWTELKRFHYGRGDWPSLVSLGPDRVGVLYRRERLDWNTLENRITVLENLWGSK